MFINKFKKLAIFIFCLLCLFFNIKDVNADSSKLDLKQLLLGKVIDNCKIVDVIYVPSQYTYDLEAHYEIFCFTKTELRLYTFFDYKYLRNLSENEMNNLLNSKGN